MSGNENSEDESKKFYSKIASKKQKNDSNSPSKIKNAETNFKYSNQNEPIRESLNEEFEDLSVDISYANNQGRKMINNNYNRMQNNAINYNKNAKPGWNNLYSKKTAKINENDSKFISNNTEINNKRFEVATMENKRNIVNGNLNKVNIDNTSIINNSTRGKAFKSKSKYLINHKSI